MPPRPTGGVPSPRHHLVRAERHKAIDVPPSHYAVISRHLATWGNDVYGVCTSSEEAFAKADSPTGLTSETDVGTAGKLPIFVRDEEVIEWALERSFAAGASCSAVLTAMADDGFSRGQYQYLDGLHQTVDWTRLGDLQHAIWRHGPLKLGVDSRPLDGVLKKGEWFLLDLGPQWFLLDQKPHKMNLDHTVSLCGYGSLKECAEYLGIQPPPASDSTAQCFLLFTWGIILVVDHPSLIRITGEAWVRTPVSEKPVERTAADARSVIARAVGRWQSSGHVLQLFADLSFTLTDGESGVWRVASSTPPRIALMPNAQDPWDHPPKSLNSTRDFQLFELSDDDLELSGKSWSNLDFLPQDLQSTIVFARAADESDALWLAGQWLWRLPSEEIVTLHSSGNGETTRDSKLDKDHQITCVWSVDEAGSNPYRVKITWRDGDETHLDQLVLSKDRLFLSGYRDGGDPICASRKIGPGSVREGHLYLLVAMDEKIAVRRQGDSVDLVDVPDPGNRAGCIFEVLRGIGQPASGEASISLRPVELPLSATSRLRHRDYKLVLGSRDQFPGHEATFDMDSSFVVRPGLVGKPASVSFESVNYPGYFIRRYSGSLYIDDNKGSNRICEAGGEEFANEASFFPMFADPPNAG